MDGGRRPARIQALPGQGVGILSDKLRFGEILVRANVLDRAALDRIAREWKIKGGDLGELLVQREVIDESVMLQTVGKALNLPTVSLESISADERAVALVPRALCVEHMLVPVEIERSRTGQHLHVAMANPSDVRAIKQVTRRARLRIRPLVASAREIRIAIARWYPRADDGAPTVVGRAPAPPVSQDLMAPPPQDLNPPPAPVAPPPSDGGADALFDFGVFDLSAPDPDGALGEEGPSFDASFGEPPAPPEAPSPEPLELGSKLDPDLAALLEYSEDEELSTSDLNKPALGAPSPAASTADLGGDPPEREPSKPHKAAPAAGGDAGFGIVSFKRGRGRRGPGDPGASAERRPRVQQSEGSSRAGRPLPPLPPGMTPEPAPQSAPVQASDSGSADRVPDGVIDDRARLDIGTLLERYTRAVDESDEPEDEVIATWLARYGRARRRPRADEAFDELDHALSRVRQGAGRTLLALIRYLARRGLVDPEELLSVLNDG